MILGDSSAITITTAKLLDSLTFYERIGFLKIDEGNQPVPWILVSDGSVLIRIKKEKEVFFGITYFTTSLKEKREFLINNDISITKEFVLGKDTNIILFHSDNGFPIRINEKDTADMYQPTMHSKLSLPNGHFKIPGKYPNKKCGVFGEFSYPVKDLYKSIKFWESIGYELYSITEKPYLRAIITDRMNIVGLHQTREFNIPSLAYYAIDMPDRIEQLRREGVEIFKELSIKDNRVVSAIIRSPDNVQIALYSF